MHCRIGRIPHLSAGVTRLTSLVGPVACATALVLGVLTPATPAFAAAITVTTTADDAVNGNCSLREAIRAANANAAVDACPAGLSTMGDVIVLAAGVYQLSRLDADPPDEPFPPLDEDGGLTGDLDIRGG